jgi:hypothetical protein
VQDIRLQRRTCTPHQLRSDTDAAITLSGKAVRIVRAAAAGAAPAELAPLPCTADGGNVTFKVTLKDLADGPAELRVER